MNEPEKHRDDEKRRMSQERDKRSKKDHIYEDDNAAMLKNKNKAGRFIKPEKKEEVVEEQIKVITIPETITIKDLADKMKLQPSAIVKKLFMQGQIVTVNQEVDFETAENIAIDYDIICEKEVQVDVIEELLKEDDEDEKDMVKRPPVICVMGHVDHGKTSLLDAIRKTNVTDREAGGITQHIGAYTVNVKGEKITFLDTPGHEAFTAMRMRGANSTDIAILVVAADDGVMPQTVEAINHAKAAGIEIIVAVNKIDKPNANIDRVKQELTEYELIPVDWGGTTEFVPVSAKSGEGIDTLLETIILTAEILELKANPNRQARGLVIEAELDKGRGSVATVLVQKGTLHVGDFVSAGAAHGKVRAMVDDKGRRVKEAGPSTPVEILGLSDVPNAGEILIAHENDKTAKQFAETFVAQNKVKKLEETKSKMSLDDLFTKIQEGNLKELNLIIKADVQGSVEAVKQSLLKLSNEEVVVKCIHGGVGAINESDVMLAAASGGLRRISAISEKLIPVLSAVFILGCFAVIIVNIRNFVPCVKLIVREAFTVRAVSGFGMAKAMRYGISRGVFSNEAGLGSSAIIHSSARCGNPAEQGMWGILEVFIDTVLMCTVTAAALLMSGVWQSDPSLNGVEFCSAAFSSVFGAAGGYFLSGCISLFALATLVAWSYYGSRGAAYLFGKKSVKIYNILYAAAAAAGCVLRLESVWSVSDTLNGLMAVPNLFALLLLSGEAIKLLKDGKKNYGIHSKGAGLSHRRDERAGG